MTSSTKPIPCMAAAAVLAMVASGCAVRTTHPQTEQGPQTILSQYAEMLDGKVTLIADFEDPAQKSLVDVVSASGRASCKIEPLTARRRGDRSALRCTLVDPRDAVVFDNSRAEGATLEQDWRPYDLLLARILAPDGPVVIDVSIASGSAESRRQTGTTVPLDEGWNFVRLDLSEAVDRVDMGDIRQISIRMAGDNSPPSTEQLAKVPDPITFAIDDLILAQNRSALFGQPDNAEGTMYVQNQGRRWRVGAGRHFELIFSQGQIVGWYDLARDPDRSANLVQVCAMGPMPTVLPELPDEPDDHAPDFTDFGTTVHTRQRVVEMNNVRVIIDCEWTYSRDPSETPTGEPIHRWRYAIYRSGQIYVDIGCRTAIDDWSVDSVGLALCIDQIQGADRIEHSTAQLKSPESLRHVSYAAAAHPDGTPSILFVVHDGRSAPQANVIADPHDNRLILLLSGGKITKPTQNWACMVQLSPADGQNPDQFGTAALAYAEPLQPTIRGGTLNENTPGDADQDGFNESLGTYQVQAHGDPLTITFNPVVKLPFNRSNLPTPEIVETPANATAISIAGFSTADVQATVNGQPLSPAQKAVTSEGNLLIQLTGAITESTVVTISQSPQIAQSQPAFPPLSQPSMR